MGVRGIIPDVFAIVLFNGSEQLIWDLARAATPPFPRGSLTLFLLCLLVLTGIVSEIFALFVRYIAVTPRK